MTRRSPEEIEALKAKYAAENAAKEDKRSEKRAKHGKANADQNMPTCEMRIPFDIDLERPPWDNYCEALESVWRSGMSIKGNPYTGPCKWKVVRT